MTIQDREWQTGADMGNARNDILAGHRILIVEDEYYLADDLRAALSQQGATIVGPASTVARARQLIDDGAPDFAILDINLKGELIFPLADDLRRRGIPFLFTTGYDAAIIPAAYRDVDRWEKPVDAEEIAVVIAAG